MSATPDCPLRIKIHISLYFHTPLWNYPGASAPSPLPRAGQDVRWTQLVWGSQTRCRLAGARALPCFLGAPQALEPHLGPSLSVSVLGWGGGRGTLLGINFTLWILLLSCLLPSGEGPVRGSQQLCLSSRFTSLGLFRVCDGSVQP